MNKTASEFLKREDIIKPNHTSFFIQFNDGSQIELTEVLNRHHQEQLIIDGVSDSFNTEDLKQAFNDGALHEVGLEDGFNINNYR